MQVANERNIRHLSLEEITDFFESMGEKKFRAKQVYEWLWQKHAHSFADMTNLSKELRQKLGETFTLPALAVDATQYSADGTVKSRFRTHEGHLVEGVLIPTDERKTACVSSQIGCSLSCKFCATGYMDRKRNLEFDEIFDEVVLINEQSEKVYGKKLTNIVFMGMGEPLANEPNVWAAVERIHGDIGISARHLTISTVGIVPGIKALTQRPLPVNLAVSLHAARDQLRTELVPINERYPIKMLMETCREYLFTKGRRITFEWALIDAVNDTDRDARELAELCLQLTPAAHVNLIPLNPTPGSAWTASDPDDERAFVRALEEAGVPVTVRDTRGREIDGACGQLAAATP